MIRAVRGDWMGWGAPKGMAACSKPGSTILVLTGFERIDFAHSRPLETSANFRSKAETEPTMEATKNNMVNFCNIVQIEFSVHERKVNMQMEI